MEYQSNKTALIVRTSFVALIFKVIKLANSTVKAKSNTQMSWLSS